MRFADSNPTARPATPQDRPAHPPSPASAGGRAHQHGGESPVAADGGDLSLIPPRPPRAVQSKPSPDLRRFPAATTRRRKSPSPVADKARNSGQEPDNRPAAAAGRSLAPVRCNGESRPAASQTGQTHFRQARLRAETAAERRRRRPCVGTAPAARRHSQSQPARRRRGNPRPASRPRLRQPVQPILDDPAGSGDPTPEASSAGVARAVSRSGKAWICGRRRKLRPLSSGDTSASTQSPLRSRVFHATPRD